ncbi:MAG: hypothetical protein ACOYL6_15025 [Bacteriovoracaceae bacterium]
MKKCLSILFLGITFFTTSLFANELTLYFIHAPKTINWSTPYTLSKTTVENSLIPKNLGGSYSIGHVYGEINCPRLNVHEFTGQTSTTDADRDRVLKLHWGLGAMIGSEPGKLQSTEEVKGALSSLYKSGRVAILKMRISENACERVVDYLKEYRDLKLGDIYGGLDKRPLYKEGSGCSAFGASLMEVAGVLLPEQKAAWSLQLGVPYRYVGGPRTGKKVTIAQMLVAFNSKWTKEGDQNGLWIDFFDPSLMNKWVKKTHKLVKKGKSDFPFATEAFIRNKAQGVYFDMTSIPTPTGPIFYE